MVCLCVHYILCINWLVFIRFRSSYSSSARDILGFGSQASNGFAAADVERSSVILCGRAFANTNTTKDALVALAAPVISARGGLPLSARLLLLDS